MEHDHIIAEEPAMDICATMRPGLAAIDPDKRRFQLLPFIRVGFKHGRQKINWWHVRPTGNEYEDNIIGRAYALEALQFLLTPGMEDSPLLYHVFAAMGKKKHADIERGFIATLAAFARKGAVDHD